MHHRTAAYSTASYLQEKRLSSGRCFIAIIRNNHISVCLPAGLVKSIEIQRKFLWGFVCAQCRLNLLKHSIFYRRSFFWTTTDFWRRSYPRKRVADLEIYAHQTRKWPISWVVLCVIWTKCQMFFFMKINCLTDEMVCSELISYFLSESVFLYLF